jgi:hypothetical protein
MIITRKMTNPVVAEVDLISPVVAVGFKLSSFDI